jgi:hypothetical protein
LIQIIETQAEIEPENRGDQPESAAANHVGMENTFLTNGTG